MESSQFQEEFQKVSEMYTQLTSFLIELGYKVYVDQMYNMDTIECLETTMHVLEIMDSINQEAQSSNINKETVIDEGLESSGNTRKPEEGQQKVVAKINSEKLKELIKESLESSLKERTPKKIQMKDITQYRDSMEELLAGFRAAEALKPQQSPKIDNERLKKMTQRAEAWRQQMFSKSIQSRKWKPAPKKQYDYFYDDASAPSTSAAHNTSINVENLNLEI